jgi:hypothetical protein
VTPARGLALIRKPDLAESVNGIVLLDKTREGWTCRICGGRTGAPRNTRCKPCSVAANVKTVAQRWAIKVQLPTDPGGCWEWVGGKNGACYGYGHIWIKDKWLKAHRVGYEMFVGPIPRGLELDHLCRNRACVNPSHLEPVSRRTNNNRGRSQSALNSRKTHCARGHEFTQENTYYRPTGGRPGRHCRRCRREDRRKAKVA